MYREGENLPGIDSVASIRDDGSGLERLVIL